MDLQPVHVECQVVFQVEIRGSVNASEPGWFDFTLTPYVDRHSEKMGVRERHYKANIHQVGQFLSRQNLGAALTYGIHRTLQKLIILNCIPENDRV